ncbi:hypothetical protein SFUMM280S_06592 [Streptomyces fumanus]
MTENRTHEGKAPGAHRPAGAARTRLTSRIGARAGSLPPWSPLVAGVLVGALAGGGYGLLRTPQYTATSYVVAVPAKGTDPASALGYAQAYGRVATQLRGARGRAGVGGGAVRDAAEERAHGDLAGRARWSRSPPPPPARTWPPTWPTRSPGR